MTLKEEENSQKHTVGGFKPHEEPANSSPA